VSEPAGSGGGTPFAGRDPAPAVLDRFAGHAFPVLGVSAAVRGADGRPVDRKTGRPGVLLLTGDIRWRRRYDAEIDVLRLAAAGDPSGRTYRVVWRHGRWTVVDVAAEGMP
jgi:hypothetical protein